MTASSTSQPGRRIHVIINPAAGQDTPVLATLNTAFQPKGVNWSVSITQQPGDAKAQAEAAVAEGVDVVAVYGGDGTVTEAASGMVHTDVPLALLPGGTANVMARELSIPFNLPAACEMACLADPPIRVIDVGQVNQSYFLLRVGIGAEAKITERADREMKDRLGFLAYVWAAMQNLVEMRQATYHISIDGVENEFPGVTCGIVNSGKFGLGELQILPNVRIDDGLLDVILVQDTDLPALATVIGGIMGLDEPKGKDGPVEMALAQQASKSVKTWQCREVKVWVDPPQTFQYDGEILQADKVHCRILPKALRVIAPIPNPK